MVVPVVKLLRQRCQIPKLKNKTKNKNKKQKQKTKTKKNTRIEAVA